MCNLCMLPAWRFGCHIDPVSPFVGSRTGSLELSSGHSFSPAMNQLDPQFPRETFHTRAPMCMFLQRWHGSGMLWGKCICGKWVMDAAHFEKKHWTHAEPPACDLAGCRAMVVGLKEKRVLNEAICNVLGRCKADRWEVLVHGRKLAVKDGNLVKIHEEGHAFSTTRTPSGYCDSCCLRRARRGRFCWRHSTTAAPSPLPPTTAPPSPPLPPPASQ